jgi:FkbM family methyltransferase
VDLGAHCGHFSMLADLCLRAQFGRCDAEYHLVEPNPELVPVIRRNLLASGLCPRHHLHQGLVGRPGGTATLWVQPKNFLAASLHTPGSGVAVEARYIDLRTLVGDRFVDVLKVDIEGAEYELLENYADLLPRVGRILMEIHGQSGGPARDLCAELAAAGFRKRGQEAEHGGFRLAMFERAATGVGS